jgi:hypothetical protein
MDIFLGSLCIVFGYALCWFTKDNVVMMATGTENYAKRLEAQVAALKAKL